MININFDFYQNINWWNWMVSGIHSILNKWTNIHGVAGKRRKMLQDLWHTAEVMKLGTSFMSVYYDTCSFLYVCSSEEFGGGQVELVCQSCQVQP